MVDKVSDDIFDINEAPGVEFEKVVANGEPLQKSTSMYKRVDKDKEIGKEFEPVMKTIPWLLLPFSQWLKKKQKYRKYQKFMLMLKELSINIPLMEVLT